MDAEDKPSLGVLGSLAGYAMSDSDDDTEDMHRLSGNISGSDDDKSSHSQAPSRNYSPVIKDEDPPEKKIATASSLGLVSYGGHEEDENEDSGEDMIMSEGDDGEANSVVSTDVPRNEGGVVDYDKTYTTEDLDNAVNGAVSDQESTGVVIPPSPPGSPPQSLIDKIAIICRRGRGSLDAAIQNRKDFRNPSIYDKLLSHVGVNEKGTNYPPELFDPSLWDKSSYYDELAKLQNVEMEKRKADKKDRVKVDFITATKSGTASTESTESSAGNKRTKWDTGVQPGAQAPAGSAAAPPAVGSLIKKKQS